MEPPILKQSVSQSQNLKQVQRMIMSFKMQQALHFLELPIMELTPLIEAELEQNPVLESDHEYPEEEEIETPDESLPVEKELDFETKDFDIIKQIDEELGGHFQESGTAEKRQTTEDEKLQNYLTSLICQKNSLFSHLMEQAREILNEKDLKKAEIIIGSLDNHGFLTTPLKELAILNNYAEEELLRVLKSIQTLDPKGVGACNLQESLLLQLSLSNKENTLAYSLIQNHYDDLLHNRIPLIAKHLNTSPQKITDALKEIAKLQLNPISNFTSDEPRYIVPDITIKEEGEEFVIFVNEDPLPPLRLNPKYLKLLEDKTLLSETKAFIEKKIASAKWLLKNLTERNETLVKIVHLIVKKQKEFLKEKNGTLVPMTMLEIATELNLHESTITRAISNKYAETPKGLLLLRSFFTNKLDRDDGTDISTKDVKSRIFEIIQNENKKKPLSDDAISKLLEKEGIVCKRRTIAKYRTQLKCGNTRERKTF